jgi:carbon storage regulator
MLVLARKSQESVVVGGSDGFGRTVQVTVPEIDGGEARLGFEIEKEVPIHRWEVWERIRSSGRAARREAPRRLVRDDRPRAGS